MQWKTVLQQYKSERKQNYKLRIVVATFCKYFWPGRVENLCSGLLSCDPLCPPPPPIRFTALCRGQATPAVPALTAQFCNTDLRNVCFRSISFLEGEMMETSHYYRLCFAPIYFSSSISLHLFLFRDRPFEMLRTGYRHNGRWECLPANWYSVTVLCYNPSTAAGSSRQLCNTRSDCLGAMRGWQEQPRH